jgi:AraC family transcriptional regulator
MKAPVMTTEQKGLLAFYYHRRDRGGVSEHQHHSHQISITIGKPVDVRWWTANGGKTRLTAMDGNVIVNPAEEPHAGHWDGAWESIGFYVDAGLTAAVAEDIGLSGKAAVRTSCGGKDAATYGLARTLLDELDSDPLSCRLYAESLANFLAVRLLRGCMRGEVAASGTLALSASAMRRVEAFVADNLDHNLSVSEIAAVARLSAFHFSRCFKARTGMGPYEYVTRQRVERACQLLSATVLPIPEIAYRSGFASQSHLGTRFRRIMGTSPARYRQTHS